MEMLDLLLLLPLVGVVGVEVEQLHEVQGEHQLPVPLLEGRRRMWRMRRRRRRSR